MWRLVRKIQVLMGLLTILSVSAFTVPAMAANGAVIFMYHRFGENDWPTTSIRLEQFDAHLQEIARGGYTVLPIPEIIDALQNGRDAEKAKGHVERPIINALSTGPLTIGGDVGLV